VLGFTPTLGQSRVAIISNSQHYPYLLPFFPNYYNPSIYSFFSAIYQGVLIFLLPKKVVEARPFKI
jgi:hypothetical protein